VTLEIFTAMKTEVVVFWVVTPCSDVAASQPRRPRLEEFMLHQKTLQTLALERTGHSLCLTRGRWRRRRSDASWDL